MINVTGRSQVNLRLHFVPLWRVQKYNEQQHRNVKLRLTSRRSDTRRAELKNNKNIYWFKALSNKRTCFNLTKVKHNKTLANILKTGINIWFAHLFHNLNSKENTLIFDEPCLH